MFNELIDIKEENLLSVDSELLNILLKDNIWARIEEEGIEKERMKDALLYLREDEERGGKTVLGESELLILRDLLFRLISG